eukprot:1162142-Pelagomonas_calceolata.AAC.4
MAATMPPSNGSRTATASSDTSEGCISLLGHCCTPLIPALVTASCSFPVFNPLVIETPGVLGVNPTKDKIQFTCLMVAYSVYKILKN